MNAVEYEINYAALANDFMALDSKHKAMVKRISEIVGADQDEDLADEVERYAKRIRAVTAAAVAAEREAIAAWVSDAADDGERLAAAIRARNGEGRR